MVFSFEVSNPLFNSDLCNLYHWNTSHTASNILHYFKKLFYKQFYKQFNQDVLPKITQMDNHYFVS